MKTTDIQILENRCRELFSDHDQIEICMVGVSNPDIRLDQIKREKLELAIAYQKVLTDIKDNLIDKS